MFAQLPALVLGILSTASVITTTFWNQWSITGPTSTGTLGSVWGWRSLWAECFQYQTGQSQCQGMNSMFRMSERRITLRAMMVTSIILSFSACFGILLGMECTRVFEDTKRIKRKLMQGCALCYLFTAILTLAAVAWYTYAVYHQYFSIATSDNIFHWELGGTIYLGYISSLLSALAFLACICCPGPGDEEELKYQPARYGHNLLTYSPKNYKKSTSSDTHKYTDYV